MLTRDDIVAVCPPPKSGPKRAVWDGYVKALTSAEGARLLKSYGIDTPNRMIGLFACVFAPETGLTLLRESGAYSASRIVEVFGAHRHSSAITDDEARRIAALPINPDGTGPRADALFERAYGIGIKHCCKNVKACTHRNAKGKLLPCQARSLGNWAPGDGAKHPGIGLPQCTGRAAQEAMAKEIGCRIEDLVQPINSLTMVLIEWDEKNCNTYADKGNWQAIRSLFNTGRPNASVNVINGLPEMRHALVAAKRVFTPEDFENEPVANVSPAIGPPPTMAHSTESQAAAGVGMAGGWQVQTEMSSAMAALSASGQPFSIQAFAMQIMSSPGFWLAAFTVLGAAYWWFKRRARLYLDGV